jgi:hypothetical protein
MRKQFHGQQRSHTKSGPGRFHGEGRLFFLEGGATVVREPAKRLRGTRFGGNWKGAPYLSQYESDHITGLMLSHVLKRAEAEQQVLAERAA